jgi:copper resistance protein B
LSLSCTTFYSLITLQVPVLFFRYIPAHMKLKSTSLKHTLHFALLAATLLSHAHAQGLQPVPEDRFDNPQYEGRETANTGIFVDFLGLARSRNGSNSLQWDGGFWLGNEKHKFWTKSSGSRSVEQTDGRLDFQYTYAFENNWETVLGLRHDFGSFKAQDWMIVGIQGTGPFETGVELLGFWGAGGQSAVSLKLEKDIELGNGFVLMPKLEGYALSQNDPTREIGAGLTEASATLRLRYELTRHVAPYIGVSYTRLFGNTAQYARETGNPGSETLWLAGVQVRF